MPLSDKVSVARVFQRSVRIDTDISTPTSVKGFVCPPSSATALQIMARHIAETGQAAFTWTGPYGSGKSSLAVALAAALDGDEKVRDYAAQTLGEETISAVWQALPLKPKGWRVLPVVGSRTNPAQAIGEAIARTKMKRVPADTIWKEQDTLNALDSIARRDSSKRGGLLVIIDEMGKFLESAAYDGTDIYFFQQLAELASRSDNRLIVVGALHQAFEGYTNRLSREIRDEWAKIQGRFIDLAIDVSSHEQLSLLSRAIEFDEPVRDIFQLSQEVSELTDGRAPTETLENCWPLHPVVACLLGPISRRRFGQNQRSLFGFLNSAEPAGFQDFLRNAESHDLYSAPRLWDYLRLNMESSIMASPDGHRWGMAMDAIERCRAKGGEDLHVHLLQTIALLDLFGERSGLAATTRGVCLALSNEFDSAAVKSALSELQKWAILIYREFSGSYGIYEGSDFDMDDALDTAYRNISPDFQSVEQLGELKPIFAKRHYHQFGSLRWYDAIVSTLSDLGTTVTNCLNGTRLSKGSTGAFILAIHADRSEAIRGTEEVICTSLEQAVGASVDIVVGNPSQSNRLLASLVREFQALQWILENMPELRGDRVARAEVHSRIASTEERIASELERALDTAVWHFSSGDKRGLKLSELNSAASDVADSRFSKSPRVFNELLNRINPSSSAAAGRNVLLRRMIANEGQHRLGIEGYPAEGGLFDSLLSKTELYREVDGVWRFAFPEDDERNLCHIWRSAEDFLRSNFDRAVSMKEIYEIWRQPPYGVKEGIMPVMVAAFLLSNRSNVAFYREGVFQSNLDELDAEVLCRTPQDISVRWMGEYRTDHVELWVPLVEVAREVTSVDIEERAEPIEVARALVTAYDELPKWTERTSRVSDNAKRVRRILKDAHDPNKVIFDEIAILAESRKDAPKIIEDGMRELRSVYPCMLKRLRNTLLSELGVADCSKRAIADLRARAENIRGISGDYRMESFIMRMAEFDDSQSTIEELASLSITKPSTQWADADVDRATIELAKMSLGFIDLEVFAHVKGREDWRHTKAIAVGIDGAPFHERIEITDIERPEVEALVKGLRQTLQSASRSNRNVILAALAEVSAGYMEADPYQE
jgi:hypothetical protein